MAIRQGNIRFPGIMIAIMKKENNLPSDLGLQTSSRLDLRKHKTIRKYPARLLAQANNRIRH
jgi:hypothetical protein